MGESTERGPHVDSSLLLFLSLKRRNISHRSLIVLTITYFGQRWLARTHTRQKPSVRASWESGEQNKTTEEDYTTPIWNVFTSVCVPRYEQRQTGVGAFLDSRLPGLQSPCLHIRPGFASQNSSPF